MKKVILFILFFIVILLNNSQAQILENSAIKLGGVIAYQVNNAAPRVGISLGFSKDIIIWNRLSIASELSYIQKGYVTSLSFTTLPFITDENIRSSNGNNKLEYLSLSLFGKLRIGGESFRSNSYLIGGLRGDYFLGSTFGESSYKQTTLGLLGGIGGEINISAPFKIILELVLSADLMRATVNTTRELKNTTIELKSGIKF